jgi:hypothetical protein
MARGYWSKRGHTLNGLNPNIYTSKTDKDGNLIDLPSASLKQYWEIRDLPFGSARRQAIVQLLSTGFLIPINGKHCIQLNADPDLRKLLNNGKIEMYNERNSTFKRTIIRYKDGSERRKRKRN